MTLSAHYEQLYLNSIEKIRTGQHQEDLLIDDENDLRRGITLIIKPNDEITQSINFFLKELAEIDGEQYYQPKSDMHLTVLSIISCYEGFELDKIDIPRYVEIINQSIKGNEKMMIEFNGITTSLGAVMIQGFSIDEALNQLRDNMRVHFKNTNLEQSIDARYAISTAHLTAARFRKRLKKPDLYAAVLEKYREFYFGQFKPETALLVYNDWYQKESITKTLHKFRLY